MKRFQATAHLKSMSGERDIQHGPFTAPDANGAPSIAMLQILGECQDKGLYGIEIMDCKEVART